MDSGSLALDSEIEDGLDFSATVSPEEIVWLMDELMFREVTGGSSPCRSGITSSR